MEINTATPLINEIYFEVLNSTQVYAREAAYDLLQRKKQWYVIRSNTQTNGIGQADRKWLSPAGNIYATFIIPLEAKDFPILRYLSLISAKSVCQTLESFGLNSKIKWVNDVLINDKKISGVLVETVCQGSDLWALIGVGINVNSKREELNCVDQPATSVFIEKGNNESNYEVNAAEIFTQLKCNLYLNVSRVRNGVYLEDELIEYLKSHIAYLGKIVKIVEKKAEYTSANNLGIFRGITNEGYILLYNGNDEKVYNDGRMFLVRSALVGKWVSSKSNDKSILIVKEDNLKSFTGIYTFINDFDNKLEICIKGSISTFSQMSYLSFYGRTRDRINTENESSLTWSGQYCHENDEINSNSIIFENLYKVNAESSNSLIYRKEIFKRLQDCNSS